MNDDRKFNKVKENLLKLLDLNMPNMVISKVLNISGSSVNTYKKKLKEISEWDGKTVSIDNAMPDMLKVYASYKISKFNKPIYYRLGNLDEELSTRLIKILEKILEINKIEFALKYGIKAIMSFSHITYKNVPLEYQDIINDVLYKYNKSNNFGLYEFIRQIAVGKIKVPDSAKFKKDNHFVTTLLDKYVNKIRNNFLAPQFTEIIVEYVNDAIAILNDRTQHVIYHVYGLNCKKRSLLEIGNDLKITQERAKQIRDKGLRKVKKYLYTNAYLDDYMSNAWEMLQEKDKTIKSLQARVHIGTLGLDNISKNTYEILITKLSDINFSVRTENCFRVIDIEFVWELTMLNLPYMLKFRNVGKNTLTEIQKFLKDNSLKLEMKYTKETIEKLKKVSSKK